MQLDMIKNTTSHHDDYEYIVTLYKPWALKHPTQGTKSHY